MIRRASGLAALLIGIAAAGCGGGGSKTFPDATVPLDSGGATTDGGVDQASGTPPMPGANSQRIVPGQAFLVGSGFNSCTSQVPATGDRWCAFAKPSSFIGQFDLWVINVSKAAGTAVSCNGSDTNCLRLTTNLYDDPTTTFPFEVGGFDGDTLIYYAEPGPDFVPANPATGDPGSGFIGVAYAWRPGWTGGRAISPNDAIFCGASPKAASALCLANGDGTTVAGQVMFDLHAGPLPAEGGAPLPKLDTLITSATGDPTTAAARAAARKYDFDLSADGMSAAWSTRLTGTGPETLKVQRFGAAAATTVATDVSRWQMSPDGTRWYWLSAFNYSTTGAPAGTLQSAPFPGGAAPTMLAAGVGDYAIAGATGIVFRDGMASGRGALKAILNTAAPAPTMLDTGVLGVIDFSKDGSRIAYAKNFDTLNAVSDLLVATVATGAKCTLSSAVNAEPTGSFLDAGGGFVWLDYSAGFTSARGWYTDVATCAPSRFSTNIASWIVAGNEGFIFGDDTDFTAFEINLRYSKVSGATLPMGTSAQTRAFPKFAAATPSLPAVIYTVNVNDAAQDGLYMNAMLPFTGN